MNIFKGLKDVDFNIVGITLMMLSFLGPLFESRLVWIVFATSGSLCLGISVWKAYKSYEKAKREYEEFIVKHRVILSERYGKE